MIMKYLIILLMLFSVAYGQTPTLHQPSAAGGWTNPNPAAYGTISQGLVIWKQLGFPTGNGAPIGTQKTDLKTGLLYLDSTHNVFYTYNPKTSSWSSIGGGVGGIDSIFITRTDSIFVVTSTSDTIYIGNLDLTRNYLFAGAGTTGGWFQVGGADQTFDVDTIVQVATKYDLSLLTSPTVFDTSNGFPPHVLNILDTPLASAVDGDIYLVSQNPPQFLSDGTTANPFYTHHNEAAELIDGSYTFVAPGNSQTITNGFDLGFYEFNLTSDVWNLIYKPHIMGYTAYGIPHILGVADSNDIVFGTNSLERGRFTADGRFVVNNLQHAGDPTDSDWVAGVLPNGSLYAKKGTRLTLTTTGTSGPATLIDSVLNIPQYSGGGSGSTDYVNSGLGIKVDSTGRSYTVNLDTAYTNSLYGAVTSTDTTIYQTVLDSTGASGYKVPFAVNRKLQTSPSFLYDSTQKKLVIGSTNISIGGNSTKLWVTGSAVVSDKLGVNVSNPTNTLHVNGDVRISTIANGTAGTDSILTVNGGVVKKIAANSYLNPSDTTGKWVTDIRRQAGSTTVEKKIGSTWSTAFTDSVGGGGSSGLNNVYAPLIKSGDTLSQRYNVLHYGATGDGIADTTGAMTSSSATLTTTNSIFAAGDVGKVIVVVGAGTSSRDLVTTIASYTSATQVSLTASASTTVSNARVIFGTDQTAAIQAAINACNTGGGGIVRIPKGIYIIAGALQTSVGGINMNSQLYIPYAGVLNPNKTHIKIQGEVPPNFTQYGAFLNADYNSYSGSLLVSTQTTGATGAAVIGTGLSSSVYNYNYLTVENLSIKVLDNPAGAGPVIGGISMKNGATLITNSVAVNALGKGTSSVVPSNDVAGIETPDISSETMNHIENTLSAGFKSGYKVGEHALLDQAQAFVCYYGFNVKASGHTLGSARTLSQWCTNDLYFSGTATIDFKRFDVEYMTTAFSGGKWYDNLFTINDSANRGSGVLTYDLSQVGSAINNAHFTIKGATGLSWGAHGVPSNIVSTSTFDSLAIRNATHSATLALRNSNGQIGALSKITYSFGSLQPNDLLLDNNSGGAIDIANYTSNGINMLVGSVSNLDFQVKNDTVKCFTPYKIYTGGAGGQLIEGTANNIQGLQIKNFQNTNGYFRVYPASASIVSTRNKVGLSSDTSLFFAGSQYLSSGGNGTISFQPGGIDSATALAMFMNKNLTWNKTRFEMNKGTNVSSAGDLTLGTDGNVFHITGTTTINAITTTNWNAGSEIILIFDASVTVKNNTAGGASTAVMLLGGGTDFSATSNDVLKLVFDGVAWYEESRSVN